MITLLYWRELQTAERNITKLVEFMGGEVRCVDLSEWLADNEPQRDLIPDGGCWIAHAEVLVKLDANGSTVADPFQELLGRAAKCLVWGFETAAPHGRLLTRLTSDGLASVEAVPEGEFSVDADAGEICGSFAGLKFGKAVRGRDLVFVEGGDAADCKTLIRIENRPFLVSVRKNGCGLLLLACREMADVDESIACGASVTDWFSRLGPLLMFVRNAEGTRCWHNDTPRACLILDDPLLREQYGFLNFDILLGLMKQEQFCTAIAFIPWNYRRSNRRIVELFKNNPQRYSLCVHGCDHTDGEFGNQNSVLLQRLAWEGLRRMTRQRELSGIGFDDVMVFPQGCFSTIAMNELKSCGYLAAVNTSPFPVDSNGYRLRLRDLLGGAVTKFSGFPLFTRHYPNDLAGLAFALLLGKPALIVEHHGYFRNGYTALAGVVRKLREMEPRLEWSRLSVLCSKACLKRNVAGGECQVRFYTDRFSLKNDTDIVQRYTLFQQQADKEPSPNVFVNSVPATFSREAEDLRLDVNLGVGQSAEIEIRRDRIESLDVNGRQSVMLQAGVFVRRYLSEFRDNHMDKNPFLSRVALRMRNHLVGKK